MDQRKIQDAIALLDHEVPRDGAHVKLHQYGGGPDEGQVVANEAGFLRLGIEFLKGAFAPSGHRGEAAAVEIDLEYLVTSDSSINFDWFERRAAPEVTPPNPAPRVVPVLIFTALAAGVVLSLIGFVTVVRWLAA